LVKNIPSNHIREMNNISGVEFKSVPIYWSKQVPIIQKEPKAAKG